MGGFEGDEPQVNARARTVRGLVLAAALDRYRREAEVTTAQLAGAMRMTAAMTNRIMTGRRVPSGVEIGGLCALLEVPAAERPFLYELARTVDDRAWELSGTWGRVVLERVFGVAARGFFYDPHLIPRPLRTDEYARAFGAKIASGVPRVHESLIPEHTLTRAAPVVRSQLMHLLDNPGQWRVIPADEPTVPGFALLEMPHFQPVLHLELLGAELLLEDPRLSARYQERLQALTQAALSPEDSVDLVRGIG
ncbi:Scr1 family TA system antitoxin-like transcriptional regulator [Actinokineospora bangkokensis]|nr:Scr1 family TA system antitoxin-like transcriptional regulator [Actinokineospora bangkokensis]